MDGNISAIQQAAAFVIAEVSMGGGYIRVMRPLLDKNKRDDGSVLKNVWITIIRNLGFKE